jgi:hypothetical protein
MDWRVRLASSVCVGGGGGDEDGRGRTRTDDKGRLPLQGSTRRWW